MAFFGLTHLGYQNVFKERRYPDEREGTAIGDLGRPQCFDRSRRSVSAPVTCFHPGLKQQITTTYSPSGRPMPHNYVPAEPRLADIPDTCAWKFPPIIDHSAETKLRGWKLKDEMQYNKQGRLNSNQEYSNTKHMSKRADKETVEDYRYPVTTSHNIGWWRQREPIKTCEPWTTVPRHCFKESEMTKFVKEMHLTNREFTMF